MLKSIVKDNTPSVTELEADLDEIFRGVDMDAALFGDGSLSRFGPPREVGEIVEGEVLSISRGQVLVDYGGKSEAILPYQEEEHSNEDLDVGDKTRFLIIKKDNGQVVLSRKKIDLILQQRAALEALHEGKQMEAKLLSHSETGWIVDLGGIPASLPASQEYLFYSEGGPAEAVGQMVPVEVETINGMFVTVTRKPFASAIKKQVKSEFMEALTVGQIVEGIVKNVTDFGAFIQVASGVIGLCHSSDFDGAVPEVGQTVRSRVKRVDEKNRIFLGIKQVSEPTWQELVQKYEVGTIIKARVKSLVNFGAFMELEDGVDGLVHVSDLSWSDHIKHPKEMLSEGQEVDVVVLTLDEEKQHLSLGIKQISPDPWDTITDRYLVGSEVEGEVTNKTNFGVFIRLEPGVDGLAHHTVNSQELEIGEKVVVLILRIDVARKRIQLGLENA